MSADLLRRAAAKMRENAAAATTGPWFAKPHFSRRNCMTVQTYDQTFLAMYATDGDAEHIASWPPDVALAVADWLEDHYYDHSSYDCQWDPCKAEVLARAYLGEDA